MKKLIFFTIAIFIWFSKLHAQHCAYDFASIIVVSIHEKDNLENISNLKVTIVDSSGNPVLDSNENEMLFWQNPRKTTSDYNNPAQARKIRYPFAKNNYVLVLGGSHSIDKYYLKIEEKENFDKYRLPYYQMINLYEVDKYRLCDTYNNEDYKSYIGRLYKPVEIIINKK